MAIKTEILYTKAELLQAKRFAGRRDVLLVCLDEKKKYTPAEAEAALENFYKKEVKDEWQSV